MFTVLKFFLSAAIRLHSTDPRYKCLFQFLMFHSPTSLSSNGWVTIWSNRWSLWRMWVTVRLNFEPIELPPFYMLKTIFGHCCDLGLSFFQKSVLSSFNVSSISTKWRQQNEVNLTDTKGKDDVMLTWMKPLSKCLLPWGQIERNILLLELGQKKLFGLPLSLIKRKVVEKATPRSCLWFPQVGCQVSSSWHLKAHPFHFQQKHGCCLFFCCCSSTCPCSSSCSWSWWMLNVADFIPLVAFSFLVFPPKGCQKRERKSNVFLLFLSIFLHLLLLQKVSKATPNLRNSWGTGKASLTFVFKP